VCSLSPSFEPLSSRAHTIPAYFAAFCSFRATNLPRKRQVHWLEDVLKGQELVLPARRLADCGLKA